MLSCAQAMYAKPCLVPCLLCCALQDVSELYKDNKFDLAVDSLGSRSECCTCCVLACMKCPLCSMQTPSGYVGCPGTTGNKFCAERMQNCALHAELRMVARATTQHGAPACQVHPSLLACTQLFCTTQRAACGGTHL